MPKIGMRIIKSSLAVGICLLISLFRSEGIVFYSCIAGVLCIQQDVAGSKKVAINRVKGTLLGGFFGLLILMLEKTYFPEELLLARYLLIMIMIIPIIYTTVLLKMTSASYITCVVFMSVTISHGMDVNPVGFTVNRMVDTLIGIFVALLLNAADLFRYKNTNALFVSNLDHTLLRNDGTMSSYTKVKLKQLLEQGANITIATRRTPSTFLPMMKEVPFTLPIIVLNGAACYDMHSQEYTNCICIQEDIATKILAMCRNMQINYFATTITHHMLHVYYEGLEHEAEHAFYHQQRKTPYKNMVWQRPPEQTEILQVHLIQPTEVIEQLLTRLSNDMEDLHIVRKVSTAFEGYESVDFYDIHANKLQAVRALQATYGFTKVYAFGSNIEDQALLASASQSFVVANADSEIKEHATMIKENDKDSVVTQMTKLFHKRSKTE